MEIQNVCGSNKITEDKLCQLPYLCAVFHETLRKHSPVPIVPLRYVHEDTQLGGYHVPKGAEVISLLPHFSKFAFLSANINYLSVYIVYTDRYKYIRLQ